MPPQHCLFHQTPPRRLLPRRYTCHFHQVRKRETRSLLPASLKASILSAGCLDKSGLARQEYREPGKERASLFAAELAASPPRRPFYLWRSYQPSLTLRYRVRDQKTRGAPELLDQVCQ